MSIRQNSPAQAINDLSLSTLYRRVNRSVEQELELVYRSSYAKFEMVLTTVCRDREAARDTVQAAFAVALTQHRQSRGDETAAEDFEAACRQARPEDSRA